MPTWLGRSSHCLVKDIVMLYCLLIAATRTPYRGLSTNKKSRWGQDKLHYFTVKIGMPKTLPSRWRKRNFKAYVKTGAHKIELKLRVATIFSIPKWSCWEKSTQPQRNDQVLAGLFNKLPSSLLVGCNGCCYIHTTTCTNNCTAKLVFTI